MPSAEKLATRVECREQKVTSARHGKTGNLHNYVKFEAKVTSAKGGKTGNSAKRGETAGTKCQTRGSMQVQL